MMEAFNKSQAQKNISQTTATFEDNAADIPEKENYKKRKEASVIQDMIEKTMNGFSRCKWRRPASKYFDTRAIAVDLSGGFHLIPKSGPQTLEPIPHV